MAKMLRLNLVKVEQSLLRVKKNWKQIDDELERKGIGRKDHPFDKVILDRMMTAYSYLDYLLGKEYDIFQRANLPKMLELNHYVHYGEDNALRLEYYRAMQATNEKFYAGVPILKKWYEKHQGKSDDP